MADDRYVYVPSEIWNMGPIYSWEDDILPKISQNYQYVTQFENAEKYMFVPNLIGYDGNINILNIDVTKGSNTSSAKMFIVKTPEKLTKSENRWGTVEYDGCYWKVGADFYLTGVFGDPQSVGGRSKNLWIKNYEYEHQLTNANPNEFGIIDIMDSQFRKKRLSIFSRVSTLTESSNYYPVHYISDFTAGPKLQHVFLQGLGYLFYDNINYKIQRSTVAYTTFWISNAIELSYNLWAPKYDLSESGILFEKDFSTKTRKYSSDRIEDSIVFHEYPEFFEYQGISSYDYSFVLIDPKTGELSTLPQGINCTITDVDYTRKVLKYTIPENKSDDWKVYYIGLIRNKYINYGGETWYNSIECMLIIIQEPDRNNYEFIYTYQEGRTELIKELEGTNKFSLAQTNYIKKGSINPQITIKNEIARAEIYVPRTCSVVSPPDNISIVDDGEFLIYTLDYNMESLTIQYNNG